MSSQTIRDKAWHRAALGAVLFAAAAWGAQPAHAQAAPGVTATEIKLGQTAPLSGPVSAWGMFAKAPQAYFDMVNAEGGINGRKVKLIVMDDGYAPPKTVEQTRKLVEQERVLAMMGSVGTAQNVAIKGYLHDKGVPMLFAGIGANIWGDAQAMKWATMWAHDHRTETGAYARYVLKNRPGAKIAILSSNDDGGRNLVAGFKSALGDRKNMIVAEATFEQTDPTVDSQVLALKASGADVFVNLASPRSASQAIRKAFDLGWKPLQFVFSFSTSMDNVLKPAGLDRSTGIISATFMKDPSSPEWKDDPGVKKYLAFLKARMPDVSPADPLAPLGYSVAELTTYVIRQAGPNLTRETLIRSAKSVKDLQLSLFIPGIKINTNPDDPSGIHELRLQRFDGARWQLMD